MQLRSSLITIIKITSLMSKLILGLSFLLLVLAVTAQKKIEIQLGGSNFVGASLNAAYRFPLSEHGRLYLEPNLGIGLLMPGWDVPTNIIHTGLNVSSKKKWGFGLEGSWFFKSPFHDKDDTGKPDMPAIIYPNINYTIIKNSNWYFKFSAGAYFAFSRQQVDFVNSRKKMTFEGDVIPGFGICIGRII